VGDPISHFALTSEDFFTMGQRLADMQLPTSLILEGGYAASELGLNAVQVLRGFESRSAHGSLAK
jgi:acetoin utilization deacetylase AcuC-like enzyme